ncbi:hydantoinase/oxoprolinase family protein [Azospirillum halopraeferens]|uniref:hydantoinase/oxoprolinase family protein n=1 Tax=Azospirillum halopraeferens TaxID=34010 RepID=UPI000410E4D7|nr:hydantoinase/oxoprolinase family protein [Azospirillum halopraeferens]
MIGWDIGGAHLKAAWIAPDGSVGAVRQAPCRLWEGLDRLDAAFAAILADLPPARRHAVTMTGELVDLFPDRARGVAALVAAAAGRLPGEVRFWAGEAGFLDAAAAADAAQRVASANWLATAEVVARRCGHALVVDIGSTTTDLVPVAAGRVAARGRSDRERLEAGELVYTGLTRTPVMAVADTLPWRGATVPVMAEHFATTADVHRVLGRLDETADQHPPADGGPATPEASARRLGRCIGVDLEEAPWPAWRRLAAAAAERQMQTITRAAHRVLSAALPPDGLPDGIPDDAPVVGAGVGRALAAELARRLDRPYVDVAGALGVGADHAEWAAHCAPAVAVARLLA